MHIPRNEYPRPQFTRNEWTNLNGEWTYKIVKRPPYFHEKNDASHLVSSKGFDAKIVVPFPPESRLSQAGEDGMGEKDIITSLYYHRILSIPASYKDKRILLHFGAVFYHAEIYIEGALVGFHDGGSTSFTIDISHCVKPGSHYNLVVKATSNLWDGSVPSGKQSSFFQSYKCFYTRITGIWQTVWMEGVSRFALKRVRTTPNIDEKTLLCTPEYYALTSGMTLTTELFADGKCVATHVGEASDGVPYQLSLESVHLWNVDDPFLYTLRFTLRDREGSVLDEVGSYIGMRKVQIVDGLVYLNNTMLYQRLVLDQGYYPDGLWTAPNDEALRKDIELAQSVGFNGARLHQKVFEERFYFWADTLGYLCWAESPSWGLDYNTEGLPARNFLAEWAEIIHRDVNHPSIITWTPMNETFQFANPLVHRRIHRDAYSLCKMIDPSRPVNDSSGYIHFVTDLWTVHTYEQDPKKLHEKLSLDSAGLPFRNYPEYESEYSGQPYLVDEYGGIKWDPATQGAESLKHGQNMVSWGYGESPKSLEEFYSRILQQTRVINDLEHVSGYCYTQLTDVEQEKNGLFFYDRSVKFDLAKIREVFSFIPGRYR